MVDFMAKIKEVRINNNLTQAQLAKCLKIDTRTLRGYELGEHDPSLRVLKRICNYFNITADYFVGITDKPTPINQESRGSL
jgi:transcriptional regulator with XRE-family HTH domain